MKIGELILATIFMTLVLGGIATFSYFRAQAFERACGVKVSTWDATFLSLRVDSCLSGKETKTKEGMDLGSSSNQWSCKEVYINNANLARQLSRIEGAVQGGCYEKSDK